MDTKEQRIQTLARFQKEIASLGDGEFVYRGQSDKEWNVTSTAYRRLSGNSKKPLLLDEFIEYHENLISNARNYGEVPKDKTDLDLLAELQHYGAATSLIDFSYSAVIALWFACQDSEKNGKVFCLNAKPDTFFKVTSEDKKETIEKILTLAFRDDKNKNTEIEIEKSLKSKTIKTAIWQPSLSNNRIIKQDSIFIFNQLGKIKNFDKILIISKDHKAEILKNLESLTGITETRIYPDFYGFAQSNAFRKPYKVGTAGEINSRALIHHLEGRFDKAEEYYSQAIKLDLNDPVFYYNRGVVLIDLRQDKRAIKDFEQAKAIYINQGDIAQAKECENEINKLKNK